MGRIAMPLYPGRVPGVAALGSALNVGVKELAAVQSEINRRQPGRENCHVLAPTLIHIGGGKGPVDPVATTKTHMVAKHP